MNDKSPLPSSLDIFLLSLIDSGVTTSYAMREQAGISVGASPTGFAATRKTGAG